MGETVRVVSSPESQKSDTPPEAPAAPPGTAAGPPPPSPPEGLRALGGRSGAMPRWLPRAMVLALVLLGLFKLADWAFHQLIDLFVMLLVAFFLSLALEPAVDRMAARGIRRGLGTFLVFVAVVVA